MKIVATSLILIISSWGLANAQEDGQSTESNQYAELEKDKSAFRETWVHPEADFTRFNKLYLWEGQFEFRDVGPARRTRTTMMSTRSREFGISDADRQKFEEVVSEAFDKEIAKGKRFTIVDEIGPNTMIMRGAALDIISRVPPERIGASEVYLATIGEATLVLELLDAETGGVLAVVAERRQIGSGRIDGFSMPTNSVAVISHVKRWARSAAAKLRTELDKAIAAN